MATDAKEADKLDKLGELLKGLSIEEVRELIVRAENRLESDDDEAPETSEEKPEAPKSLSLDDFKESFPELQAEVEDAQ